MTGSDFSRFDGRPWRERADVGLLRNRWREWRKHPCASILEAMLDERGLDELDVLITASGPSLAIETVEEVRFLDPEDEPSGQALELEDLAGDLDHVVAWRLRDRMIAATLAEDGGSGSWVQEPMFGHHSRVRSAWSSPGTDAAAPSWAITASTPLLRLLKAAGISAEEALDAACAKASPDRSSLAWCEIAGVTVALEQGRLHCRSFGTGAHVVDRDAFCLLMPDQTLPDIVGAASRGLPLSRLVSLSSPPDALAGLDPEIVDVAEHVDPWWSEEPALKVTLAAGTETLADIPQTALSSIGINAASVPRSVKPWLAPGLRADGKPRLGASALRALTSGADG